MAPVDSSQARVTATRRGQAAGELLWAGLVAFPLVVPNLFGFQQYRATDGYLFAAEMLLSPFVNRPTHFAPWLDGVSGRVLDVGGGTGQLSIGCTGMSTTSASTSRCRSSWS